MGVEHPNPDGSNRRTYIILCQPGEPVELRLEPKNPKDPRAVAVYSERGGQLGYITAERAPWIGGMLRSGRQIDAIFQAPMDRGAWIRVGLDGEPPTLPEQKRRSSPPASREDDSEWWPDEVWPDE